ncbi:MAG TPA: nuclear transport factor 2 family protein [Solirubrobacteraceae bacterium]|jgi:ketosteroid isomerase-like protein|nr:nuclear transport factor 2 family protein [Solirubrobacteraceae bacterium]
MSRENVAIVQRSIDAVNRRDADAYAELIAPEFELFPAMTGFAGASFRGPEGLGRYFEELRESWEEFQVEAEEFRDLGGTVLVLMRLDARGRGSGVPVVGHQALICELRAGKLLSVRSYLDRGEALRAAGVAE